MSHNRRGLDALVHCLRRYVEANPSRFNVVETSKSSLHIRTIVRSDERAKD